MIRSHAHSNNSNNNNNNSTSSSSSSSSPSSDPHLSLDMEMEPNLPLLTGKTRRSWSRSWTQWKRKLLLSLGMRKNKKKSNKSSTVATVVLLILLVSCLAVMLWLLVGSYGFGGDAAFWFGKRDNGSSSSSGGGLTADKNLGMENVGRLALQKRFGEKCRRGFGKVPLLPERMQQDDVISVWDVKKEGNNLPSMKRFYMDYIAPSKPLLMRGALKAKGFQWSALKRWLDDDYLARVAGNYEVNVERSRTGKFGYEDSTWKQSTMMKFRHFLDQYKGADDVQHKNEGDVEKDVLYMSTDVIDTLQNDIVEPTALFPCYKGIDKSPYLVETGIWFGAGGQNSLLHSDPEDNILAIVDGYKRLFVFPPGEGKFLYEKRTTTTSPVNIDRPDYDKYPLYKKAKKPIEVILGPSDALFIPRFWFHQVESSCRHIAVNFWADLHDHEGLASKIDRMISRGKLKSRPQSPQLAKSLLDHPSQCPLVEQFRQEL